jgi:hypothetical protein
MSVTVMPALTKAEWAVLTHALGMRTARQRALPGYRNGYSVSGPSVVMAKLVRRGLMEKGTREGVYHVTILGAHAVGLSPAGFRRAFPAKTLKDAAGPRGSGGVRALIRQRQPWHVVDDDHALRPHSGLIFDTGEDQ